jgi:hypothetical protein
MSSIQEQYAETIRTSQQAVVGAVEAWSKSLQSAFSSPGLTTASAVDPNQVIDQVFDFAEKMLEVQREFAKNLASTAAAAGETTRQQAEAAMKTVQDRPSSENAGPQRPSVPVTEADLTRFRRTRITG